MMRLDRFLCELNIGSRSQVKTWIKKGMVCVNEAKITSPEFKVNEEADCVIFNGQKLLYQSFYYYILNKPAGVVTSTEDPQNETVMSLLKDAPCKDLFPVGRLDKDTEGLLLITNDGPLAHALLAPKSHVDKTYYMTLAFPFTNEQKEALEKGVDIGEKHPCFPAQVKKLTESSIELTIHEGKFHQVKRMLKAVGNEVTYLKRTSFGSLFLDEATLSKGSYRSLSSEEIALLKKDVDKDVRE